MCGIAGYWSPSLRRDDREWEHTARRMVSTLAHRGPDDEGTWGDTEAGVALAHRRLAILDLSHEGHQPMRSVDGRYVLVFNGEIYNFRALRASLVERGHAFRGNSDTEVMLAAFSEWGVFGALERFVGMFAFALWDRVNRQLCLGRDRAGEKPLYYGWIGDAFVFGSELKSLRAHPRWSGRVDRGALALLLRQGYIPAPRCIYENVFKLTPGCVLSLNEPDLHARSAPPPGVYWSLPEVAAVAVERPFGGAATEAIARMRTMLLESVARQMVADVPLGAFLSGGIDSSLVVALMQAQSSRPIQTFSIGFEDARFDEAPFAAAVARHLGTEHTEHYVQARELQEVIPKLPIIYDEPLADPSQIPTVLLCRLARSQVKVSLSGDAGDELFGGYDHYRKAQRLWRAMVQVPGTIRHGLTRCLKSCATAGFKAGLARGPWRRVLNRLLNVSDLLPLTSDRALYEMLASPNRDSGAWLMPGDGPLADFETFSSWEDFPEFLQRMMCHDSVSYLPDDILVKVDRAAMFVSLETRIPLLDHRIIEFAWRLPTAFKQVGAQGKWMLRRILDEYVPCRLVDRPKRGFAAPVADWLRGALRDWAEALLAERRLRDDGFFAVRTVRQKWREHLSGSRDWSPGLWHVLMFQAWLEEQKTGRGRSGVPAALAA